MPVFVKFTAKLWQYLLKQVSRLLPLYGTVYMIHDVSDNIGEFVLSCDDFEFFAKYLKKRCNVVKLEDLFRAKGGVSLTIDDVPVGFYYNGFPILKQYSIPFTIFVNIELLDKEGYITTAMLQEIADCGLATVGSHGTIHTFYRDIPSCQRIPFFEESKCILQQKCKCDVDFFAFPYGSVFACGLSKKGLLNKYYKYGFGTISAPITKPTILPRCFLPRINVSTDLLKDLRQHENN